MPAGGQLPVTARPDRSGPVLSSAHPAIVGEGATDAIDPANFLIGYIGNLGDLIARLQPRGFAETILIAAIWLHYRDGRSFVTRDDIRRLLRRQEHLRMPKNFGRDFHTAITRGYIEPVDEDGGFAATGTGYQWFRDACIK